MDAAQGIQGPVAAISGNLGVWAPETVISLGLEGIDWRGTAGSIATMDLPMTIERLRDPAGRPRWFDPDSRTLYLAMGLALAVEFGVIGLTDFELGRSTIVAGFLHLFTLLGLAALTRRVRFSRVAVVVESAVLLPIAGSLAVTGTVLLAAISGPFVDSALDASDRALGFDFVALVDLYRAHPDLAMASRWAYGMFALQAFVLPVILALTNPRRFWVLGNMWVGCLAIAVLLFPVLPTSGPFVHYGVTEDVFPNFLRLFPWETGPAIEAIRSGAMRDIGQAARSFISIPSFHAVGGVLFAWAAWPSQWLRWPMALLNAAMVASAIVTGAHYLIDLIAGAALAGLALWVVYRKPGLR